MKEIKRDCNEFIEQMFIKTFSLKESVNLGLRLTVLEFFKFLGLDLFLSLQENLPGIKRFIRNSKFHNYGCALEMRKYDIDHTVITAWPIT